MEVTWGKMTPSGPFCIKVEATEHVSAIICRILVTNAKRMETEICHFLTFTLVFDVLVSHYYTTIG